MHAHHSIRYLASNHRIRCARWRRSLSLLVGTAGLVHCANGVGPESALHPCGDEPGVICTWAGTGDPGFDGDGQPLQTAQFYWPIDLTIAADGTAYILDWNNHRVRRTAPTGTLETAIGTDFVGDGPYDESDQIAPGAPGGEVHLNHPTHLLPLRDGHLLLSSWHNHKLRLYDPDSGLIQVICGGTAGFAGDGGPARQALLSQPSQAAEDATGHIYILDQRNQRVRRIDPDGIITTVVGTGQAGFSGEGSTPRSAQLHLPDGPNPPPAGSLAIDSQGRLYISDTLNQRVRRADFALDRIETIAGTGAAGYGGDGGPAIQAKLNNPRDIAIGPDGRLYIADEMNHRVRAVDLRDGRIETIAGSGHAGFDGDGKPAIQAALNRPAGLEFDQAGFLYIADTYNHRIRRLLPEER